MSKIKGVLLAVYLIVTVAISLLEVENVTILRQFLQ